MTQENKWDTWKDFIYTASHILAGAEKQLQSTHGISLSDFDVLVTVHEAEKHSLSMCSLTDTVLVTTSGLSRSVQRLAERGWLIKEPSPTDKRQVTLKLTDDGIAAFKEIAPSHRAHVRNVFFNALSPNDDKALAVALRHLRDHMTTP